MEEAFFFGGFVYLAGLIWSCCLAVFFSPQ